MSASAGPRPGAYRALVLATLAFALCFAVWGLVSPLATRFQELYELSSTQISVVIATPVILGSLFRIPIGLLTDRFGGRAVFSALMLVLIVPVLFIGLLGGSFGGLLFWGFFLGLAGPVRLAAAERIGRIEVENVPEPAELKRQLSEAHGPGDWERR